MSTERITFRMFSPTLGMLSNTLDVDFDEKGAVTKVILADEDFTFELRKAIALIFSEYERKRFHKLGIYERKARDRSKKIPGL